MASIHQIEVANFLCEDYDSSKDWVPLYRGVTFRLFGQSTAFQKAQLHVADLEHGAGLEVALFDLRALDEGAVGGALVLDEELVRGPREHGVVAADGGVVEDDVVLGGLADLERLPHGERLTLLVGVQEDELEFLGGDAFEARAEAEDRALGDAALRR